MNSPGVIVDSARLAELCRRYHVRELALFGSAAKGGMREDSDIDILVEFSKDAEIGLLEFAGLMLDFSQSFGRKVDLVSKRALRPLIRDSILQQTLPLYAA